MLFSSLIFLYLFLPIVLLGNYSIPKKFRNVFLLTSSLIFFAWGGVSYSVLLILSLLINYFIGKAIGKKNGKVWLGIGISINVTFLLIFKYANFFSENFHYLFANEGDNFKDLGIILPIGISFYTFQAISYLIDVYRKTTPPQLKFVNLALYISFFPQLIAGPIVRYRDIAKQLISRESRREDLVIGIERFILGLGKKVLIANQLALIADSIFSIAPADLGTLTAWMGIFAYSMQIYFDFSAYSDMAIGLGRMFGFKFLENFNFPYISRSIRDFWYRWHISLSNWFRDYLYISLGGNRKGIGRTYINLFIVFFITGFWHGASWTFIVWGLIHGVFMVIEKLGFDKVLKKLWLPIQHIYTLLVVSMSWVVFRSDNFDYALSYYHSLFVFTSSDNNLELLYSFANFETYFVIIISILGSTRLFEFIENKIRSISLNAHSRKQKYILNTLDIFEVLGVILVLLLSSMYLVAGTYNPFIYFRF